MNRVIIAACLHLAKSGPHTQKALCSYQMLVQTASQAIARGVNARNSVSQ
jgi:hypothetical protein